MSVSVRMPELEESVTEGLVTRWLKEVGDTVDADEPLLEVSTDKVDTEIPSPVAGIVLELLVGEDETVQVGDVLARVGAAQSESNSHSRPDTAAGSGDRAEDRPPAGSPEAGAPAEPEPVAQIRTAPESGPAAEPCWPVPELPMATLRRLVYIYAQSLLRRVVDTGQGRQGGGRRPGPVVRTAKAEKASPRKFIATMRMLSCYRR